MVSLKPLSRTATKWAAGIALAIGVAIGTAQPAGAVHLFPLTPTFDPLGHDCAKKLTAIPGGSPGAVQVVGFNFIDGTSRGSTTRVKAGQTVTWTWTVDNCHSVTFAAGGPAGTAGGRAPRPRFRTRRSVLTAVAGYAGGGGGPPMPPPLAPGRG